MKTLSTWLLVGSLVWVGCAEEPPEQEELGCVPSRVDDHKQVVVDSIHFPTTASSATQLGLNLDQDELGRVDNALGQILAAVHGAAETDFDLDASTQALIDGGQILHLLDVRTATDGCGSVLVRHGVDTDGDPTDNFSGTETFAIDVGRGAGTLTGEIYVTGGLVFGSAAPIAVTFFGQAQPYNIELSSPMIEFEFTETGIAGKIGGAIRDPESNLYPILYDGIARSIEGDCNDGVCTPGSFGEFMRSHFDFNNDGVVSYEEFRDAEIVRSLFPPDIDLFDEDGRLCRACDGVKESLSVGLGFTAVWTGD